MCRHRAGVSKVATFPEPVSVVNIQEIHADVPVFTYLHLEAGSELLQQLDHQMCIDMLSQRNVSTGFKKTEFRLACKTLFPVAFDIIASPLVTR